MARIRTIKPSYWPSLGVVSRDARLLGNVLISMADDSGRFVATSSAILGFGYPMDEKITPPVLRKWLQELETHIGRDGTPFVVCYEVEGHRYGVLPGFRKHQRISHPQPSALPAPPQEGLFDV